MAVQRETSLLTTRSLANGVGDDNEEKIVMNKIAMLAAVAAAALMAAPVAAHAQAYAGAGYTQFQYDGGDVGAATGRLGYRVNRNFAVEGEGSFGLDDDDGVELNHNLGAYAVGILPLGESFDVRGRVGYQTTEIDTPLGDADADGIAYGVGAQWNFTPSLGVRADWTRMEGDDEEADAISVGGVLNF
jgi:outer membrane immunogenic protein